MRAPDYIHFHEITALGEARDETITAEQSTAAAGPAFGVFRPVLGFFPTTFYLPVWEILPLYLGSAGGRSVATFFRVCIDKAGINLSIKVCSTPSCCHTMPAAAPDVWECPVAQLFPPSSASNSQCTFSSQSTTTSISSNQFLG
jgi:hypothetical protein